MHVRLALHARIATLLALTATGCVKGNPETADTFSDTGGTLTVPDCGYDVVSRLGAEPPRLADAFVGTDPTVRLVHLGLVGDPRTSVVAQWRTTDETTRASIIRFGVGANLTADQLTETRTGLQYAYKAGADLYRVHQAHLCGLTAGTTYSYQVGSPGPTGKLSPIYTFHTAPDVAAHPDAEVVLGFVGDSRGGYATWQALVDELRQRAPDAILFSGDAVTVGFTQYEWEDFLGRAEPLFATTPVIAAHGNHEANAVNYFSQLALPGDQENFGVDYGFAHITVFNDTPVEAADLTGVVKQAVAKDLADHDGARWKVVMHHQPLWSASTRHGSSVTLQQAFQPLFDARHVDLVLNGHDHDYEVSKPLVGTTVQASNADGTVYVVAGGAGADLYENGSDFWTAYSEKTYSAAILSVRRDQLTLTAFRDNGSAIPTGFTKTKP